MVKATVFTGILLLCLLYISLNLKRKEETQQLESRGEFHEGCEKVSSNNQKYCRAHGLATVGSYYHHQASVEKVRVCLREDWVMEERVLNRAYGFRERQSVPELRKDVEKKYPYQSFLPSYNLLLLSSIG